MSESFSLSFSSPYKLTTFPLLQGKWIGDWKFYDITSTKEANNYIGVSRIIPESDHWRIKDTYTYPNGQTNVYYGKWTPVADGKIEVTTTDPGLKAYTIFGFEQSEDVVLFRYTAPNGRLGMLETVTIQHEKNTRNRTIQFFDTKTGEFIGVFVVKEKRQPLKSEDTPLTNVDNNECL